MKQGMPPLGLLTFLTEPTAQTSITRVPPGLTFPSHCTLRVHARTIRTQRRFENRQAFWAAPNVWCIMCMLVLLCCAHAKNNGEFENYVRRKEQGKLSC